MKKFLKIFSSRMLYLCLGIFLALSFYVVQAAWNTKVTTGQSLNQSLWNDIVDKLISLDGRVGTLDGRVGAVEAAPDYFTTCDWTGEKLVCGDCKNCQDDIYINCTDGRVTRIRFGC